MALTVNFRHTNAVRKMLDELRERGDVDVEDFLDAAAATLLARTRRRFLAETDPDGKAWPKSEASIVRRSKGDTGTLFDTGSLFHSLTITRKTAGLRAVGVLAGAVNRNSRMKVADYAKYLIPGGSAKGKWRFLGVSYQNQLLRERLLQTKVGA